MTAANCPCCAGQGIGDPSLQSPEIVRHCNIRGFCQGLRLVGDGGGYLIEDNHFDGNTWQGLDIEGNISPVRRNRVFDTGGSTLGVDAVGIHAVYSVDVIDNTISGLMPAISGGNAFGTEAASNTDG